MPLDELQRSLDESLAVATAFAQTLFKDKRLTADEVQSFANSGGAMATATVDRKGRPHAAPVIGGCADGVLSFEGVRLAPPHP